MDGQPGPALNSRRMRSQYTSKWSSPMPEMTVSFLQRRPSILGPEVRSAWGLAAETKPDDMWLEGERTATKPSPNLEKILKDSLPCPLASAHQETPRILLHFHAEGGIFTSAASGTRAPERVAGWIPWVKDQKPPTARPTRWNLLNASSKLTKDKQKNWIYNRLMHPSFAMKLTYGQAFPVIVLSYWPHKCSLLHTSLLHSTLVIPGGIYGDGHYLRRTASSPVVNLGRNNNI